LPIASKVVPVVAGAVGGPQAGLVASGVMNGLNSLSHARNVQDAVNSG
jgi:hypothetical protein